MPKRVEEETRNVKSDQILDQAQEGMASSVRDEDLQLLVDQGFLPPKELAQWKSAYQNPFPSENADETIVYSSFFERGLGLPASKFLRGLLYYYRIQLVHLNPKGLSQIALFVHMCEAFLGIDPHFQLFRYFFRLKPYPDQENPSICGGAVIQLRQDKALEYFNVPLKDPKRTWRDEWFIIPQLHEHTLRKPVFSDRWNCAPKDRELIGIKELVGMIEKLKRKGMTGIRIAYSFIKRQIQPLQERSVPGYRYKGPEDPSRLKKEDLTHDEILERLNKFFVHVNFKKPKPLFEYSADKPPQLEHIASYYSPAPLPGHLTADQPEHIAPYYFQASLLEAENQVQATVVREEEARGKGHGHQYDSEEPAEEELQASVHKKPNVVKKASTRKLSVSQVVTESAPTSVPPQPEPAASSTEPHPDATLGEQFNETKDLLIQFHKKLRDTTELKPNSEQQRSANHLAAVADLQEQATELSSHLEVLCVSELAQTKARLKEAQTNCRNIQDQLDEALQREETLKGQLESEWKTFRLAESQHDAGVQRIEDLSARVEKAETEVEEFKAAATKIVRLVSELFETQSSKPLLDQLRELPNLIEEYVVKKARAYASQLLELVRALYPNHDLAPVGQGMQEDCPLQELPDHVSALDRLMKSLNL